MRILVTGGAGFIGSHLCRRLLGDGNEVTCLDNLSTGSIDNIDGLLTNPRFSFIECDVAGWIGLSHRVDQIYNLACPASPVQYQLDPVATTRTNVLGAMNVLELARIMGARILQASTSEVYGDPAVHPQKESYWGNVNPIGPRACYDEGKRCAETLFFDYHRQYGVDIRVARIFNTYGPRMHPNDGRVVSNFIVQALSGEPITIYGNGSQTRSFCYVDDMVDGLMRLMNANDPRQPINLGNPIETSVIDLARMVVIACRKPGNIVFKGLPVDDPTRRCPDIKYARGFLRWSPKVPLEDGLGKTVDYFRAKLVSPSDLPTTTLAEAAVLAENAIYV